MSDGSKHGWYVVYLPTLISLPLFIFVAMIHEYHIAQNARANSIKELNYRRNI